MGPDRFRRLEELSHAIVDLPPDLRREAIERECRDASDLRSELERLLHEDGALGGPFD